MLKNNDQDDNNSENVQDSLSDNENDNEPMVNLNITLINGKNASLEIYEGDNIEQKVKNFCITNKISPNDEQKLLQRVKDELKNLETNNSQNDTMEYIKKVKNKSIKQSKNEQKNSPRYLDFLPEQKNKLDHILNESESFSKSESIRQSNNNLMNSIQEYKSDDINKIYNENENKEIVNKGNINQNTNKGNVQTNYLSNNTNKNINNITNNNVKKINLTKVQPQTVYHPIQPQNIYNAKPQGSIIYTNNLNNINNINNINNKNISMNTRIVTNPNDFNNTNILSNTRLLNTTNNLNNNKKLINIDNNTNKIQTYNSGFYNKPNNYLFNNSNAKINSLNNTFQNINTENNPIIGLNNNKPKVTYTPYTTTNYKINQTQKQPNPINNIINKKIEYIDYNNEPNNIITQKPQPIISNINPSQYNTSKKITNKNE